MITNTINIHFLSNMWEILEEEGIHEVSDTSKLNKKDFRYSLVLDGFNSLDYLYLNGAITIKLKLKECELDSFDCIPLMDKDGDCFLIERDNNAYVLKAKTKKSLKDIFRGYIIGKNGLITKFDNKNKETLDDEFRNGNVAFINYYKMQLYGLKNLANTIDSQAQDVCESIKTVMPPMLKTDEFAKAVVSSLEMARGIHCNDTFGYTTYIMAVFSFIEHVALLTSPFWFATKAVLPQWKHFWQGFSYSDFDTFRDFWNCKDNWIDSFIYTMCKFTKAKGRYEYSSFDCDATDKDKDLKYLYDRLRLDYRNPIHHGFATGQNRTGLSMEVPSLKKKIIDNASPLLREIDTKAYEDTKRFLELFLEVYKEENSEILKYLETGWNVPVDCSELGEYLVEGNMDSFIEQYEELSDRVEAMRDAQNSGISFKIDLENFPKK